MSLQKLDIYQLALRFLADQRLAVITDDIEARYALDDAWNSAPAFVLGQAPWRFALETKTLVAGGTALPGYSTAYVFPADWLRTHAIFLPQSGRELPFDLREQGAAISVNAATAPAMRYVSSSYADPSFAAWPEHFAELVGAYLAFLVAARVTGDRNAPQRMSELFASLLPEAVRIDAVAEDVWLPHQRSGDFLRIARTLIDEGFWRFALKTALIATPSGAGDGGLTNAFAIPADWSRTRMLYRLAADGRRCPFDVREVGGFWHTNAASFYAQYVSLTLAMDSTKWPDHYMRAILRQIEFDIASRADREQSPPTYGRDYQLRADQTWREALAAAVASEADTADPWLAHQLDGSFLRAATTVLARGNWTFAGAMKTLDIDVSSQETASPDTGFPYRYPLPTDWFKTCALFIAWDGQECPINIRQSAEEWSTDATAFTARYISTNALDATTWPEIVARAVLAFLDWQAEPKPSQPQQAQEGAAEQQGDAIAYEKLLADALAQHSVPDDDWLRFQLAGRFIQGVRLTLEKGRWRFSIKTVRLESENDSSDVNITIGGTVTAGDTLSITASNSEITNSPKTISVTVASNDNLPRIAAKLAQAWNADIDLSNAEITASSVGAVVSLTLGKPLAGTGIPLGAETTFESGSAAVSWTTGVSAGATETLTVAQNVGPDPSPGYLNRFAKPADWLRTIRLYFSMQDGARPLWFDTDYRDEGGYWHANFGPIVVRYISRDGLDSTRWSANFRDAVLAWCQHIEARADPKAAAIAAAKFKFWEAQCEEAEGLDDANEVPQIRTSGRFVRGRYGRGTLDIEQALPPFAPL